MTPTHSQKNPRWNLLSILYQKIQLFVILKQIRLSYVNQWILVIQAILGNLAMGLKLKNEYLQSVEPCLMN